MDRVIDRMSVPAVTVHLDTPASEILKVFDRGRLTAVPVLDDEGRVAGVVSTTDMVRRVPGGLDAKMPARELMSAPALVAAPAEELDLAAWRLVAARAHRLVVIEDERPVGVLSVGDVIGGFLDQTIPTPLRSIMSQPVASVMLGAPISEALARLTTAGVHGLVVLDGLAPVGIFGQAEALAARRLPPPLQADPVEELMSEDIVSLDAETPIQRAAYLAWTTKARRILVSKKGQLVGIVSDLDIVDALARAAGPARSDVTS